MAQWTPVLLDVMAGAADREALRPLVPLRRLRAVHALGVVLSIAAIVLEELAFRRYTRFSELLPLFGRVVLENFGHRHLVAFRRRQGMYSLLRKVPHRGRMERKGYGRNAARQGGRADVITS